MKVDSDEFYLTDVRSFIKTKVKWYENVIFKVTKDYRFTSEDARAWDEKRETLEDRSRPIQDRRKYWETYPYGEARIYRYRPSMKWTPSCSEPYFRGVVAKNRIPIGHYQDRDPLQIHRRWTIRKFTAERKGARIGRRAEWSSIGNWRERIVDAQRPNLFHDDKSDQSLNLLSSWGSRSLPMRLFQAILSKGFGRILDATRPSFPKDFHPDLYTEQEVDELRQKLENILF